MLPPANLMSGANVLAHLTPMKRILCLCPVVTDTCSDSKQGACHIGMAISDPYLARASPIVLSGDNNNSNSRQRSHAYSHTNGLEVYWHSCNASPFHTFPETAKEFTNLVEYSDVGAIALALPLKQKEKAQQKRHSSYQDNNNLAQATRQFLVQSILKDYWNSRFGGNGLVCYIEERLTMEEVYERAYEDPDMWEEIEGLFPQDDRNNNNNNNHHLHPSLHAAVALNQFLWHHTGGWQNTFG